VEVTPRKMWPTGMAALGIDLSGRIPAGVMAEPGRALGRLTDIGWGTRLRTLLADGAPDAPIPDDLLDAMVKVLSAWSWTERPTAVVTIGSRTRPQLITTLGRRIAELGRLHHLGELPVQGPPAVRRHNSAQRLATVQQSLHLPDPLRTAVAETQGPVLLIDDRIDTGWTMTVATRLLRQAGAPAVLPLTLAVTT
jgi:ATP-dependent DNA helicase RecQ